MKLVETLSEVQARRVVGAPRGWRRSRSSLRQHKVGNLHRSGYLVSLAVYIIKSVIDIVSPLFSSMEPTRLVDRYAQQCPAASRGCRRVRKTIIDGACGVATLPLTWKRFRRPHGLLRLSSRSTPYILSLPASGVVLLPLLGL